MTAIAQAVFEGDHPRARSQCFTDDHIAAAAAIARNYGRGAVFHSLFVAALGKSHVAVVQARQTRFRFLAVPADLYRYIGDPFLISERYPANFADTGPLMDFEWDHGEPQGRTVAQLQSVLKSDDGPALLGAVQALVDGAVVVFVRPEPDPAVLQRVWQLLPDSVRGELRMATFAADNALGFHLLVSPRAEPPCVTDEQAGDYPQGVYELDLQIAVESGDERELAKVLARRSARQAMRLIVCVLIASIIFAFVIHTFGW